MNNFEHLLEGIRACLKYPRGSEAQIRCLRELGEDAEDLARVPKARIVVAEVSCGWPKHPDEPKDILSQRFEAVIAVNEQRGYKLESWKLTSAVVSDPDHGVHLHETIIAVFVPL